MIPVTATCFRSGTAAQARLKFAGSRSTLILPGLAGNFSSDDDPADRVGIEGPLNKLCRQQSTAVFLRPSKCPKT